MLGVQWNPSSFSQFWTILLALSKKSKKFMWLLFASQSGAILNIRNKFVIEAVFPHQPADCVFKTGLFLQHWRLLSRLKDHAIIDVLLAALRQLYRTSNKVAASPSQSH
jgi:hypothetical protein